MIHEYTWLYSSILDYSCTMVNLSHFRLRDDQLLRFAVRMFSTQHRVSYQAFQNEQKVKIGAKYPFLSKSQINSKVKDLWNKLQKEVRH